MSKLAEIAKDVLYSVKESGLGGGGRGKREKEKRERKEFTRPEDEKSEVAESF